MRFVNLWPYLLYPLRAMLSRRFYFSVMLHMKGVGLTYLLIWCLVLALPGTVKVQNALQQMQALDLSSVVAQIPPSYISSQGVLSANDPADEHPQLIRNLRGDPVLVYSLNGDSVPNFEGTVPITITSHALIINTTKGPMTLPWSTIYGNEEQNFEPLQAAQMMESLFSSSFLTVWSIIALWMFSSLGFVVLIAAGLTKVLAVLIFKLRIAFALVLRLNAFGATLAGLLMFLQFFLPFSLSYIMLCLIPMFYSMSFLAYMKIVMIRSMQDIRYALDPKNPFYRWFEGQSRIREDNSFDQGPDYHSLSPEEQQERERNLQRMIKMTLEQWQQNYKRWQERNGGIFGGTDAKRNQGQGANQNSSSGSEQYRATTNEPNKAQSSNDTSQGSQEQDGASQQDVSHHTAQSSTQKDQSKDGTFVP